MASSSAAPARTGTTTRSDAVAAAAIAWRHRQHALICDDIRPWEHGSAVRASTMPDYWDYNAVRVEGPDPGVEGYELLAAAEELQEGLPHRRVELEDPAAGERLRNTFALAGWVGERLLWMRRTGPAPGPAGVATAGGTAAGDAAVAIEEVSFADTRELRARWHRGESWSGDEVAVQRFLALEQGVADRRRPRAFAAREGADLIGFVSVWEPEGDDAMELEQAFVLPERRSSGLGAALVARALREAARPVQWIVADDEGRPKGLYARLGFGPAWVQHAFVRRPRRDGA